MAHDALAMVDYGDKPSILVFADSDAAEARGRRSAEMAGCRIVDAVRIRDASARLDEQVSIDAILLELGEEACDQSIGLLDTLQRLARTDGRRSVVSAPFALIDLVAARAPSQLVHQLCDADLNEMAAAMVEASAPGKLRLHDISKEQGLPPLEQISQEVARIAALLADLAEKEAHGPRARPVVERGGQQPLQIDASLIRAMIRARRLREQYFKSDLFADPAWDILLDLYAARLEGQRVAVSSLCIAAAVPPTTALRWIKTLTDMGLRLRAADPQDGRRVYIELSHATASGLEAYLTAAHRISPLIL